VNSDLHAYVAAAGYCFDLHVSRIGKSADAAFPRSEFERIVNSMQVLLLRRGWAENYPRELGVEMMLAAISGPQRKPWKEKYLPEQADDWSAPFVEAEYLRFEKAPPDEPIAEYRKTLDLVGKIERPDEKVRFATAIACDGLSLSLYDAKSYADAIAPL